MYKVYSSKIVMRSSYLVIHIYFPLFVFVSSGWWMWMWMCVCVLMMDLWSSRRLQIVGTVGGAYFGDRGDC